MAHARREFHDIYEVHHSPITTEALDRIGALYGIEREIRGQTAERRREIRQARAKPFLEQFIDGSNRNSPRFLPSPTLRQPSAILSRDGVPSRATSMMA
jgi:hypothetical protein